MPRVTIFRMTHQQRFALFQDFQPVFWVAGQFAISLSHLSILSIKSWRTAWTFVENSSWPQEGQNPVRAGTSAPHEGHFLICPTYSCLRSLAPSLRYASFGAPHFVQNLAPCTSRLPQRTHDDICSLLSKRCHINEMPNKHKNIWCSFAQHCKYRQCYK